MKELSRLAVGVRPSSTLAITARAKKLKAEGVDIIGFGAGEPDFDTPESIKRAAVSALRAGFTKYTAAEGTQELREAICGKLSRDNGLSYKPSDVVVSNGAKHALTNAFTAILNPGDEVLIPSPYWLSYPEIVRLAGGVPVFVRGEEENGYRIGAGALESALTPKTKAMIINSPNNPTGMVATRDELRTIADFAVRNDLYVISDEIYEKLIYDEDSEHISIASLGEDIFARTIVINGFSKAYAMTGWRVGYSASNAKIAATIASVQSHQASNVNSIAMKAAYEALVGPQEELAAMVAEFRRRRDLIYGKLKQIESISLLEPKGAFYAFVNVEGLCGREIGSRRIENAAGLADALLDFGVAVIPCADFGSDKHIRLAYAVSEKEIEEGVERIARFVGNC